jgi:hypothetical protein
MIVGLPKEIKEQEYRVALLPSGAYQLIRRGHQFLVEHGAGTGAGFPDAEYQDAGTTLVDSHAAGSPPWSAPSTSCTERSHTPPWPRPMAFPFRRRNSEPMVGLRCAQPDANCAALGMQPTRRVARKQPEVAARRRPPVRVERNLHPEGMQGICRPSGIQWKISERLAGRWRRRFQNCFRVSSRRLLQRIVTVKVEVTRL